jgi:cellulose synthase/poly-beta-1,6-N-acetylglucosamine synthase-like glycosyltransferase
MKRSIWGFLLDSFLWSLIFFVLSTLALTTLVVAFMVRPYSPLETYVVMIVAVLAFAAWMFLCALVLAIVLGIPAMRWITKRIDLRAAHWAGGGAALGLICSAVASDRLNMRFAPEVTETMRAAFWLTFLSVGVVSGVIAAWLLRRLRYHKEDDTPLPSPW